MKDPNPKRESGPAKTHGSEERWPQEVGAQVSDQTLLPPGHLEAVAAPQARGGAGLG